MPGLEIQTIKRRVTAAWQHQRWSSRWAMRLVIVIVSTCWLIGTLEFVGRLFLWNSLAIQVIAIATIAVVLFKRGKTREQLLVALAIVGSLTGLLLYGDELFTGERAGLHPVHEIMLLLGSLLQAAFVFFFAYLAIRAIFFQKPSVQKLRPDLLAAEAKVAGVVDALSGLDGVYAGHIGDQALLASTEDRAVVIGPPGTGKTAFLVSQIIQWADSRRPLVVLDIKPEIYGITRPALLAQGYRVLTYNPTARTGQRYNPLDDLEGPEALGELAAALIPSESAEDAVFNESARDFLDALITHLRTVRGSVSLPAIREYIAVADGYKALMRDIAQSPDPDAREIARSLMMTAANERLLGSIFATFRSNLRFLRYPAVRESLAGSDFSLSELGEPGQPVALFLQFEEQHRETTARLMALMVGHVMRYLITHTDRPPVLLLLDEIGSAPKIPGLAEKLNTIRSRHMPLWMYWQSIEQMQKYGRAPGEGPNTILGACDVQMVFRLNDNASAEWMSTRIGVTDREVRATGITTGTGLAPGATHSRSLVQEPVVFPHELQALAANEVICAYRGHTWRGQALPYFERWPEYAGQLPADTVALPYPASVAPVIQSKRVPHERVVLDE